MTEKANGIIVHKTADCYTAEFVGPHSDRIQELFETRTIPTPYTTVANANVVATAIKQRNTDVEVTVCVCCRQG